MRRLTAAMTISSAMLAALALLPAGASAADLRILLQDPMEQRYFSPRNAIVEVGDTVTWRHDGDNDHTVTSDDGLFDSHPQCAAAGDECMSFGDQFLFTFQEAGTFEYHCKIHGASGFGMVATITVFDPNATAPPPPPTPTPSPEHTHAPTATPTPSPTPSPTPAVTATPTPPGTPTGGIATPTELASPSTGVPPTVMASATFVAADGNNSRAATRVGAITVLLAGLLGQLFLRRRKPEQP